MTAPQVTVGQYLALPYNPFIGNPAKNDTILDGCVNLTNLFPLPHTVEERRVIIAAWLTHSEHLFWEVWQGPNVVGILGLSRIVVGIDSLAHLAFFDRQLWARRTLILKMLGWAFRELRLQRVSVEIPDHIEPLIRFCRAKLGFKYEGECLAAQHPVVQGLEAVRINGPARWTAKFGARKERMHYDADGKLHDLVLLRLLREEFEQMQEASWAPLPSPSRLWPEANSSKPSATNGAPIPA